MKFNHITDSIGNTPLIKLSNLFPDQNVWAKLESHNPSGSVKDRPALYMIQQAIKRGELTKDKTILEATSGNMGISLSMIGRSMGFSVSIVMSEAMSEERRKMIEAFGATLLLTDSSKGTFGAIEKANRLSAKYPEKYWFVNQFENINNSTAHEKSLAPELWNDLEMIDSIVLGMGASGTFMGLSHFVQKHNYHTQFRVAIPPKGFSIQGIQNPKEDFAPGILHPMNSDFISVTKKESLQALNNIAQTEGIFVGLSSGAVITAFQKLNISKQETVVLIFPDRGERYFSLDAF